ncbi:hypothetical protein BC374_04215 [Ensifer sp. LC13]|nr:hypothetical protein BBX50_04155 [Ensifer sp. LC11]OCP06437.1 hypothetical protein BC374_04215 [Ensifer sp. LC13]OCP06837.1 hypothetical protein BC362_11950 [Ensifer sp. LC14]OCP31324.1 hypothetical protein BC364_05880 [Ensifer sp. LC499]
MRTHDDEQEKDRGPAPQLRAVSGSRNVHVPETERDRIFEPFYRLKPRDRGAGLGLNLVLQIARRHGAQMAF